MIFASKTPRDLSHDPHPNVWDGHSPFNQMRADTDRFRRGAPVGVFGSMTYLHRPRPEFDHVQHNDPNRILVDFRKIDAGRNEYADWLRDFDERRSFWIRGEDDPDALYAQYRMAELDHARRVLTRLASIGAAS